MTTKVLMLPHLRQLTGQESGINRVVEAYFAYLPKYDIEMVRPDATSYDVKAVHAGMTGSDCTVAHLHGLYFTADYDAAEWEYRVNARVIEACRSAKQITVPSEWVAEVFKRDMRLAPHVIPHGIDWQAWQHKESNGGYVLWNKNRTADVCSNEILKPLAERFPKLTFVSTFAPADRPSNVKITKNGIVPHEQMKIMVQQAGVYLSTTKETFGIGVLEAMAAGVPVLGYAYGGNNLLVKHGVNGYLARPGDFEDLCNGLAYCYQHRDILGANGQEMAKAWSWEAACEKVAGVYRLATVAKPPTVAVVIPVYNKPVEEVQRAIDSVLAQTINADIIIVNDGSTVDYSGLAGMFTRINQANQGVANARNNGIRETDAKYICCLDADDWIAPTFLETCISALERDRLLGIAYTGLTYHKPDGESGVSPWPPQFDYDKQINYKGRLNHVPTCCVFRREAWRRIGGYQQRYAPQGAGSEDAAFWSAFGAIGYNAAKVTDEPLFHYSWQSGQVSGSSNYKEVDWLAMYPWAKDGQHPFASVATPKRKSHPVRQYDEPVISVIIPVGPGHGKEVGSALDSLEMQHLRQWEAIVVNDSGNSLGLEPYPYARVINLDGGGHGAGYARNRGVEIARAPFILFLDADDALADWQALNKMMLAWNANEAIIYSDYLGKASWDEAEAKKLGNRYKGYLPRRGQAIIEYRAADYDPGRAQQQPKLDKSNANMPYYLWCLVSILIPKTWHIEAGGFDEEMSTWEDVEYFWRLARLGYCFNRVAEPLIIYNFDSGNRREASIPRDPTSLQNHKNLIQYIKDKFKRIETVGCNCGGSKNRRINPEAPKVAISAMSDGEFVEVRFVLPGLSGTYGRFLSSPTGQRMNGKLIKYGPGGGYGLKNGDIITVHRDDAKARPDIFQPVIQKSAPPPEPKKELPPPEPIAIKVAAPAISRPDVAAPKPKRGRSRK